MVCGPKMQKELRVTGVLQHPCLLIALRLSIGMDMMGLLDYREVRYKEYTRALKTGKSTSNGLWEAMLHHIVVEINCWRSAEAMNTLLDILRNET